MRTMKSASRAACAALLAATLSGCGASMEEFAALFPQEPMTIVLPPGFEVDVDGKAAKVFGPDACPMEEPAMAALFGPSPYEGDGGRLAISPGSTSARVRVAIGGVLTEEVWTIERDPKWPLRITLLWPTGSPVMGRAAARDAKPGDADARS